MRAILAGAVALLTFGTAFAASKLTPKEIQTEFFDGKTFTAATTSGVKFKMTFTTDGKVTREPQDKSGAKGEGPSFVGQAIRLTIAAAEQKRAGVRGQVLDLVLQGVQVNRIRHARITDDGVRAEAETTRGGNETAAPVWNYGDSLDGNGRLRHQVIRTLQIGEAREVQVERYDHRRWL